MSGYRKRVEDSLRRQPGLEILASFLGSSHHLISIDNSKPSIDVKVIRIGMADMVNVGRKPRPCKTEEDLIQQIHEAKDDEKGNGTIILVEGLSPEVINILGEEFNIEPEFFANHLEGSPEYRSGSWKAPTSRAPKILPSCYRKAPFFSFSFLRPAFYSGDWDEIVDLRRKTTTPRGVQLHDGVHKGNPLPIMFVMEKASVYRKKCSNIGIILTDPLLSDTLPGPHIHDPVASLSTDLTESRDRHLQVSCRDELIEWLQQLPADEAKSLFDRDSEPLALRRILKITEEAGSKFLAYLNHYSYRIVHRRLDNYFPDNIDFALSVARRMCGHNYHQQQMLEKNLIIAQAKGCGHFDEVQDIKILIEEMRIALNELQEAVQFLVSAAAVKHTKQVTRFTKVATLLVPVNTVASILAITGSDGLQNTRFKIFGGITLPILVISSFFIFFWRAEDVHSLRLDGPSQSAILPTLKNFVGMVRASPISFWRSNGGHRSAG